MKKTTPTIAQIPSAYKEGILYNVLPNDNNSNFTWTRGSSATRVNKDGLIELMGNDVPRLDYSNSGCPRLLLENSSTNIVSESEDLSGSSWKKSESSVLSNDTTSLDGSLNADLIIPSTNNINQHFTEFFFDTPLLAGNYYTFSVFVKKEGYNSVGLSIGASRLFANYNLESKTIANVLSNGVDAANESATIEEFNNDWLRITLSGEVLTSNFTYCRIVVNKDEGNYSAVGQTYAGDGVSGVYAWGFQAELGEFASSYIPTSGTIASRSADGGTLDNISSLLGNNATLFVQGSSDNDQAGGTLFFLDVNDVILGRYYFNQAGISNTSRTRLENPVSIFNSSFKENVKLALKHNNGVYTLFMNGQQINDATEQTLFGIDRIDLRGTALFTGGQTFIDKLFIYNEELTNEELINLTM